MQNTMQKIKNAVMTSPAGGTSQQGTLPTTRIRYWSASVTLTLLLALFSTAAAAGDRPWTITDLGTLGGSYSVALGISESGVVTGQSSTAGDAAYHAFLYRNGSMIDLGGGFSSATGLNDIGQVIGYNAPTEGSQAIPVLYRGGTLLRLGTKFGRAWGINNARQIVGDSQIGPAGESRAFLYRNGRMNDLGALSGDDAYHAFFYSWRGMSDLGTLGGNYSIAFGINDYGHVIGESTLSDGTTSHAFLYSGNRMHDLGTLGGSFSRALGINNLRQIVGISTNAADGGIRAFLYRGRKMIDLNSLTEVSSAGWFLETANAINNAGQIVGSGLINGQTHAFLLTPSSNKTGVCEPKSDCE